MYVSLRTKFVIAFLLTLLLPSMLVISYYTVTTETLIRELEENRKAQVVSEDANDIQSVLERTRTDLLFLVQSAPMRRYIASHGSGDNLEQALDFSADIIRQSEGLYRRICVLDNTGLELGCVQGTETEVQTLPPELLRDEIDSPYFSGALGAASLSGEDAPIFIGDVSTSNCELKCAVLPYATALQRQDGEIVGVLALHLSLAGLVEQVAFQPDDTRIYLVDRNGQYLYNPTQLDAFSQWDDPAVNLANDMPNNAERILRQSSGVLTHSVDSNHTEAVITFQRVRLMGESLQWTLIYVTPTTTLLAPVYATRTTTAYIVLLSALVVTASVVALTRLFVRPLRQLVNATANVEDYRDPLVLPRSNVNDEIGLLVRAFERMVIRIQSLLRQLDERIHELEVSREAIQDREKKLSLALQAANAGVWVLDVETDYLLFDERTEALFGMATGTFGGTSADWERRIHPEDLSRVKHVSQLAMQVNAPYDLTYRIVWPDGSIHHLLAQAIIIRDADTDAPKTVIGINIDRTGQVEAERLQERFQREQERNDIAQKVVSMLSHDLRTPLTVISTSKDLLQSYYHRLTDTQRKEKLQTIGRQIEFMVEMLNDTVNTLRGDVEELHPTPVNLVQLCQVGINEVILAAESQHEVSLTHDLPPNALYILDEVLVSRILLNLLTNAVKYSDEHEPITVHLTDKGDELVLQVSDRGIGIPAAALPHIFDPFYRTNNVGKVEGTGLGLNVVKTCVERHSGTVDVESLEGEGTTFIVRLPKSPYVASND
jgi:PAS domain S-box-containing protein